MRLRVKAVLPHLRGRILDVGCGPGPLIERLTQDCEYIGVDTGSGTIARLQARYPSQRFYNLDIQVDLPPSNRAFETIAMMAVIEHLERPEEFFRLYVPLLERGGRIIITTPTPMGERLHSLLRKIKIAKSEVGDVHHHIYRLDELVLMLQKHNFNVEEARRFEFGMNQLVIAKKTAK